MANGFKRIVLGTMSLIVGYYHLLTVCLMRITALFMGKEDARNRVEGEHSKMKFRPTRRRDALVKRGNVVSHWQGLETSWKGLEISYILYPMVSRSSADWPATQPRFRNTWRVRKNSVERRALRKFETPWTYEARSARREHSTGAGQFPKLPTNFPTCSRFT